MTGQILRCDKVETLLAPPFLVLVQCLPDLNSIRHRKRPRLDATTPATARPTSPIVRDRSNVLYPADPKTLTCQHSNGSLRTWTRGPSLVTARSADSNVEARDALVLCHLSSSSRSLHSRVRSPLQAISLDMLTTRATGHCLRTSQISNVNHRIIEAGIDVGYTPTINLLGFLCHTGIPGSPRNLAREFKLLADSIRENQ